jgi:hypothetical protein
MTAQEKAGPPVDCIVDRHTAPGSLEHVIPYVLGGRLTTDRVCHDCNNGPCSALDAYLATSYLMPNRRLAFRTPRWEEAQKIVYGDVLVDGEFPGVLHSDLRGNMAFKQRGREPLVEVDEEGRKHVTLRLGTDDPKEVLRIAKRVASREGLPEPTEEQIAGQFQSASSPTGSRKVEFSMKIDFPRLAIAGTKIAYEFAVDTLGDDYLADEGADSYRNIILEGFDALTRYAANEDVVTHGHTWPLGVRQQSRFDKELPASAHAIVLELDGEALRVRFRLFDVYEGSYVVTPNGARLFEPGSIRLYYIDVATGLIVDQVLGASEVQRAQAGDV